MNNEVQKLVPLLLREKETLTEQEVSLIKKHYQQYGRDAFEEVVKSEKSIRPFASLMLSQIDCDSEYWAKVHQEYIYRNTLVLNAVDELFKTYYEKGGKTLVVVENFGALLSSGISIGCFASNDVDVSASREEKPFLIEAFAQAGFTLGQRGSHPIDNNQISTFFNPNALNGKGWWINVMWTTTSRAYMVRQERFDKRFETERVNSECYKDTAIRILKSEAMTYYCALHIAIEHFFSASPGMCLYCDVDRVVRHKNVNWDTIVQWANEDNAGNRISLIMDVCNHCLGTPIPLDKFDRTSSVYKKLRAMVLDEPNHALNPQLGKLKRLQIELLADNKPVFTALMNRLFSR